MNQTQNGTMPSVDPFEKFISRLQGVEDTPNGKIAWCPHHEADGEAGGHKKSLSIARGKDGCVILKCFAGCSVEKVCHAAHTRVGELFPDYGRRGKKKRRITGTKTAEYTYRDAQGAILFQAVRFEEKTGEKNFVQRRPNGEGGWINNMTGVTRVLYHLPEIVAADRSIPVFIVEGEKKADLLASFGLLATCNVGGAGKWTKGYSDALKGRPLIILPDNDEPGLKHAVDISDISKGLASSIKIVSLPGLGPKDDIVDWVAGGGTKEKLLEIVETSTGEDVAPLIEAMAKEEEEKRKANPLALEYPEFRNDVGNGKRLIRDHGENLRYCAEWDKWLVWDGKRWEIDKTLSVNRMAMKTLEKMREEVRVRAADLPDGIRSQIHEFINRNSNVGPIERMTKSAAAQPGVQVLPWQLDNHHMLLNCQNGTVDLERGVIREARRDDMLTKICPVDFDPSANCPAWQGFLNSLFGSNQDTIAYVQRLCGYWATGVIREQIMPIFWGSGANGKTTFLNVIMKVLGPDFVMKGPPGFLLEQKNESHPTEKADLFRKRLVICSETSEGRRLEESLVKEITGSEQIRARRMREDFWEFYPTHKVVLSTNHKPAIYGTDIGIWRRIRLVPFDRRFWDPDNGETGIAELRQNKNLSEELKAEYAGILSWIVQGCGEWRNAGELTPKSIREESGEYRRSQDLLGAFLDECCSEGEYYRIRASELYDSFKNWCQVNGEYVKSQRKFGTSMTERGFVRLRNDGTWYTKITTKGKLEKGDERGGL